MRQNFIQTLRDYAGDGKAAQELGAAMLQCNAMLVPEVAPEIALLIPNFQRPVITHNEAADFNLAGGAQFHVSGAPKNRYEGSIQVIETDSGQGTAFAELLMACGGMTNCIVYDGRIGRFTQAHELIDCAITLEPLDVDAEGVSTIMRMSGQMKYNYYGINTNLGSITSTTGLISVGNNNGAQNLLNRAQKVLNLVYAGNSIINAMRDIF